MYLEESTNRKKPKSISAIQWPQSQYRAIWNLETGKQKGSTGSFVHKAKWESQAVIKEVVPKEIAGGECLHKDKLENEKLDSLDHFTHEKKTLKVFYFWQNFWHLLTG